MNRAHVIMHVEALTLTDVDAGTAGAIGATLESALARLLADDVPWRGTADVAQLDAGAVEIPWPLTADAVGLHVARAVYQAVAAHAGRPSRDEGGRR
jgi:hypothetical protein